MSDEPQASQRKTDGRDAERQCANAPRLALFEDCSLHKNESSSSVRSRKGARGTFKIRTED